MRLGTFILLLVSLVWIITVFYWLPLGQKPANWNNWGDFLAGISTPVATLWLVGGYFLQATELRNSIREMQIANETNSQQTKSIVDNTNHTKRDVFLTLTGFIIKEMHACVIEMTFRIENSLWRACFSANRLGANGHGNIENLCVQFANLLGTHDKTGILNNIERHSAVDVVSRYRFFYEELIRQCKAVDEDNGSLVAIYEQSSLGQIYKKLPDNPIVNNVFQR